MLDSKKWIFVNYVPGAFGSIITKVIETSPDVYNIPGVTFDDNGASHENIVTWLENFHDGTDLDKWLTLSDDDQITYINNAITPLSKSTDLYKVHRLTIPAAHDRFVEVFTNAKFIKVIFNNDYHDKIVDMFCKKTYQELLETKIQSLDPQLYKILKNNPMDRQHAWYKKQCNVRISNIINFAPADRTLLFNIDDLFNGQANVAFDKVFQFLDVTPGDYAPLLQEFLNIHENLG